MDWYQNLYIGETAKKRNAELIRKIENRERLFRVYLITVAPGDQNQLEILNPEFYYRQAVRKGESLIIGLAVGMSEARELVRQITEDVYHDTGNVHLKEYFIQKQKG